MEKGEDIDGGTDFAITPERSTEGKADKNKYSYSSISLCTFVNVNYFVL